MIHPIQRITIPPLLKLLWIKEISGVENIPEDGRFVATPNHQSYFDDWIVPSLIDLYLEKELHMYVNRDYFKNPLFKRYLHHHECIPVEVNKTKDKKKVNENAFKKALYYLGKGDPICIYPEGHRSKDGELQEGRFGAARLAIAAKVPILPIGITGTREVWPKGKKLPRIKRIIKVKIGNPIYLKYSEKDKKILKEATTIVMKEIGKLVNKRYRY